MTSFSFFMGWTPILLLIILAVGFRRTALELSIAGTVFTILLAMAYLHTPLSVVCLSALDGILTTLPFILVIFAGILLSNLLISTGSLKRIVEWLMGCVRNTFHRSLVIAIGLGNFLEGMCVIAEPVIAPMLYTAGVSPASSAALSVIGYAGILTLEFAGMIIAVLSTVTGLPSDALGYSSGWLSMVSVIALACSIPFFLPREMRTKKRFFFTVFCGLFTGVSALAAVSIVGVPVSGMFGGLALTALLIFIGPRSFKIDIHILKDTSPFIFMIITLTAVNIIPALKEFTLNTLNFGIKIVPVHVISYTPLYSAYTYLIISFVLAVLIFRINGKELLKELREGLGKAWRPSLSMAFFGAMGQIITYTGYTEGFSALRETMNIPWIIATGLSERTGSLYPLFVPFLGWVGTFLTGYGIASLMLFGKLQVQAAAIMGVSAVWLSAGLAVGASIGSISSPFKIAIAAPMCNAVGKEGEILRITIPLGIAVSFLTGAVLMLII